MPPFKPFRLALIQLGNVTPNKSDNLKHARDMILKAAASAKKPDLIVLPECFNSPYGHVHFPVYAEKIGFTGKPYNIAETESESACFPSVAKETNTWLIGGRITGSIPERDVQGQDLYNTCTVYNPNGDLVAMHRKVHLFDIDIPGKITFKESETLTGGSTTNFFDTEFARIGLGICYDIRFPELAMISARQGAHVLIYPGAAVDNQVFFAMCSPARDMSAGYHAWGHSMVVDPMFWSRPAEAEDIIYADIDPAVMDSARAGIPVTVQRRFDVYSDVSQS
ncbi:carbon-nitrogen hydrolase [Mycena metata]|uniref:Carbon-nitrogen hydrolase n=1 Tax=Mycena metata TaxID=1033252 RepID=A0AAD7N986_9AGAR|nr:carbon-nitrogen hydrolase [Mycena metata]